MAGTYKVSVKMAAIMLAPPQIIEAQAWMVWVTSGRRARGSWVAANHNAACPRQKAGKAHSSEDRSSSPHQG